MMTEKTVNTIAHLAITNSELIYADMSTLRQVSNTEYCLSGQFNNRTCEIRFQVSEGKKISMMLINTSEQYKENEKSIVIAWSNSKRTFKIGYVFDEIEFKKAVIKQAYGYTTEFVTEYKDRHGEMFEAEDVETSGFFVFTEYVESSFPSSHIGRTGLRTPIEVKFDSDEVLNQIIIDADTLEVVEEFNKF